MSVPDKAMKLKDGQILYDDLRQRIEDANDDIDDLAGYAGIPQPEATSSDIGKALILKTIDAYGNPTSFEYGEAGGGGGTTDYTQLTNMPQIGGQTLVGNKSLSELGIAAESDIPTKVSDLLDDSGHYTKPSGGIPSTDMSSEIQTSLGKADTAYQKPGTGIPATDMASGVIPPLDRSLSSSSSAAPADMVGDLLAVKNNYVTPQMYGATGDGVTDDTQAIQNCIDDAYTRGIYRVFFPKGTYIVTSPVVIYFSYSNFWKGHGITLEGEHKGNTFIVKRTESVYKNIDTAIFCDSGESGYVSGTGCIVKNFTIKNESTANVSYCINGLHYSRGQFKNLNVIGKYGIYCENGYSNIYDDIIGNTEETFFRDGGTSNYVGKIGCFDAHNPYVLRAEYSQYDLLFGDRCTGTFVDVSPFGNCHISTIGAESTGLDCVISVGESVQYALSKEVTIDNIFTANLISTSPKYLIIKNARLRLGSLTILYNETPVQSTICHFDSNYGCCDIGEISHISNAKSYDKTLVKLVDNMVAANHFHINNHEVNGFYKNGMVTLGGDASVLGIAETAEKESFQSIVMGGYFRAVNAVAKFFRPDGTDARYERMPTKGSLILNDLTADSNAGVAGFISLNSSNSSYGESWSNKAPIPIMYCTTESNVPEVAKKNGTLLFDTTTSKLKVYYDNAWVVVGS